MWLFEVKRVRRLKRYRGAGVALAALGVVAIGNAPGNAAPPAPAPPDAPSFFTPLVPARLLDTRAGETTIDGLALRGAPLEAGATVALDVLGRGGVPADGVSAVVLNVTAVNATAPTFLTVSPSGTNRPEASNVNVLSAAPTPNLAVAKLGAAGKVDIYNFAGSVDVIVDVAGYFPTGDGFVPLVPARLLETRPGLPTADGQGRLAAPLGPNSSIDLVVIGRGEIPSTGVEAVVLNVTAIDPSTSSFVTVWPTGADRPVASNLNTAPGRTRPNLVMAKVGSGGSISIYNAAGTVDLAVDVAGYYPTGGTFVALQPARVLETRPGQPVGPLGTLTGSPIATQETLRFRVLGVAGIPRSGVAAVVLNVTAVFPTAPSFITLFPTGSRRPEASNLNLAGREVVPNLVVAKVGAGGSVDLFNAAGSTDVVVDVMGYFREEPASIRSIDASDGSVCTLDRLSAISCWGTTPQDPTFVYATTQVTPAVYRLRTSPYRLRTFTDAVDVAVAGGTACALRTGGSVWCWTSGGIARAGDGSTGAVWPARPATALDSVVDVEAEGSLVCALRSDGTVWCWGALGSQTWSVPTQIGGITDAVDLSVGAYHGCAARSSGGVACWGQNISGGLGDGTTDDSLTSAVTVFGLTDARSVSVMGLNSCAVRSNGTARCWGNEALGGGSNGPSLIPVDVVDEATLQPVAGIVEIDGGGNYRCALRTDQRVWCWGGNVDLGLSPGPFITRGLTTPVTGLEQVTDIAGSSATMCAVVAATEVRCWGNNADGQLGDGSRTQRVSPTPVDLASAT